jgi:hypothetical protein
MLKLATLGALGAALLLLSGCNEWKGVRGNGNLTTENREISDFENLEADGAFTVTWSAGAPSLSIRTDDNLQEHISTRVRNGKLTIGWERNLRPTDTVRVQITSRSLRKVELNGAVRMTAEQLRGREFYLEANGATRVTLSGATDAIQAEMNGASRLNAEALQTRAADLSINGAGRAEVNASNVLRVAVAGAGRVTYSGNPEVHKEITGAGRVTRRE